MKLRNKKTGEIVDFAKSDCLYSKCEKICFANNDGTYLWYYSLADLFEEWEDYETSKEYWFITSTGYVCENVFTGTPIDKERKEMGNYFKTEEQAKEAVEKLKAWKRLKDKGFRFTDYDYTTYKGKGCGQVFFNDVSGKYLINEIKDDLDLLFSGEND